MITYCIIVHYIKKLEPSMRMSVQCTCEEVWRLIGYVDSMTATYQPEGDNIIVGYVARSAGNVFIL